MSQPAAVSSAICCSVVLTSAVRVVVIDCTETGASPPTSTLPTLICRLFRRGASTGGGADGIPRLIEVIRAPIWWVVGTSGGHLWCPPRRSPRLGEAHRRDDVAGDEDHAHEQQRPGHDVGDRQQLADVDEPRVGPVEHLREAPAQALV